MMPQTVPNRPMNGEAGGDDGQAAEAVLGLGRLAGDLGVHHPVDPLDQKGRLAFAERALGLGVAPFLQRGLQHAGQDVAWMGPGLAGDVLERAA
jgi:hypothetical protein